MPLRNYALQAANVADRLTWESRRRVVDGQEVVIVPLDEAERMKTELLAISHQLNDIQDDRDRSN